MQDYLLIILFCIIGSVVGNLVLKNDRFSRFLGIGLGLSPAFAIIEHMPLLLLAALLFGPLLAWRRHHVRCQSSPT
jgi:hypothetical protein